MLMTESKLRKIISEEISRKKFKRMMEQATPPGGSSPFPLQSGSRGPEVERLQLELGVAVDGIFGPQTETALADRTGGTSISEEEYNELLGLAGSAGGQAGDPQLGSLGPAEVAMLNAALSQAEEPAIPEEYKKPASQDLRDFWPAWAQFLMLHYEPRTIDPETQAKFEGVLDPKVIYAKWDDEAAEQLGYAPDRVGAIQFIQAKGAPAAGSPMAEIMGMGPEEAQLDIEGVRAAIEALMPKVEEMQDYITFPVSMGDLTAAAQIYGRVIQDDQENLVNTRYFGGIYALENSSIGETLGDMALGAAAAAAIVATGGIAAVGLGTIAAGAGVGMTPDLFGRSITSMIADGFDYEAAVLSAVVGRDTEMATDIGRTKWMRSSGEALRDGLVRVMTSITTDPEYTKTQALADLESAGSAAGVSLVSESTLLTQMIDKMILEVTMGVADEDIPVFGSPPFDPEAVEEETDEEDEAAATGTGRGGRGTGTGEAALAPAAAATGRAGVVAARQQGRTERAAIRQTGRTERAAQRQGARAERREQRGERQAARGERRAERRSAGADRRAARAERRAARRG